jgi:hypothetical protein
MEISPKLPIVRQKFSLHFELYLYFFCSISKQLYIDSTIPLGTHNDILRNPKASRNPV